MEPWLDGLSEEWDSEPRSSPSASGSAKSNISRSSVSSQSRIPHLAANIRASSNSGFLRPRSTRGILRLKEGNALAERTASGLNAGPPSPSDGRRQRVSSNIPRRASSALSDSQASVQRHTVDGRGHDETPEWKRRIQAGEAITSDGLDLFSPSKLEGMFKQSSCPVEPEQNDGSPPGMATETRPWNLLNNDTTFPLPSEDPTPYRSHKGRPSGMDTLQEVEEDATSNPQENSFDLSAISSDIGRGCEIRGIVSRRVTTLERAASIESPHQLRASNRDPRARTTSGREEMSNEVFSMLDDSEKSSIRKQALQETLESDLIHSRQRIHELQSMDGKRPTSRSSDHDISYADPDQGNPGNSPLLGDEMAEMTSQSLPEDLSMGTQNYQNSVLEVITNRRPTGCEESSILHKRLPSGTSTSILHTRKTFRSSPPPYERSAATNDRSDLSILSDSLEHSVVHHDPVSAPQSTAGSPLKLFGARDTYTNNKLMRILSQFEDEQSEIEMPDEAAALRMSNFGKGELDGFGFVKNVDTPTDRDVIISKPAAKIFNETPQSGTPTQHDVPVRQSSPTKERSPKRRRTLLKDEIVVNGTEVEIKVSRLPDSSLAGTKRRDALPGKDPEPASPDTMAARPVLRPSSSRRSSADAHRRIPSSSGSLHNAPDPVPLIAHHVALELQAFTEKATANKADSRKPSFATKDYMEEANKVMEFIRARGKPKSTLPEIQEPNDLSELNPDAILDLQIEEDSTKDSFSRPPSREGRVVQKPDRRNAQHDAVTADHLHRFRDADDLDLLTSTSALGSLQLVDNKAVEEAALVPVPEDEQLDIGESFQSDPPGMRILNDNDRKRKHSESDFDFPSSSLDHGIHSDGSKRTVATSSSTGSRGTISHGTVSIPDTIGIMTFDKDKKTWVKQSIEAPPSVAPSASIDNKALRHDFSELDPFDGIPDLSIDDSGHLWREAPAEVGDVGEQTHQKLISDERETRVRSVRIPAKSSMKAPRKQRQVDNLPRSNSKHCEAAEHEERLHNGLSSVEVDVAGKNQPRVVTIAFSSPIASEIPFIQAPSITDTDLDEDDPSLLPLDDEGSVLATSPYRFVEEPEVEQEDYDESGNVRAVLGSLKRHEQYRAMTLNRRPVSRIEEYDEDQVDQELSLVHVKHNELTPVPQRQMSMHKGSLNKESSILCLTPLSEFTLHQIDQLNHPEESFVADRPCSRALTQAHGSHILVEEALVKAITDAEPTELYWEQMRRLKLENSGLTALHGLKEYCSNLEILDVAQNRINQLTALPVTLMSLNISSNLVNELTSWTHLHNLQNVDVSANQLESLECFSSLSHLRRLKASKNRIRRIDGILDLNGLVTLDLSSNDIPEVDFGSCELLSLEELDLSNNDLMHVKHLECLSNLKHLDLTDNLLEEFVIADGSVVQSLETLCLAHNEMTEFDLVIFPSLQRLNMDKNMVTVFHGLADATALTTLSAREQRVKSNLVNDILCTPHDCTELYLSSNALPGAELILPQQPNFTLRCLELASCGVQALPQGFGDVFPNIRVLNMNFNALSELSTLQGSIKLKQLLLAKNRIKKMRRTCLTLSRLPALQKLDLRDNPLTVGFYAPLNEYLNSDKPYQLPIRDIEIDERWTGLMDETTWLRRHAMELLLAQCCSRIDESDGLRFDKDALRKEQETLRKLMGKGVFKRDNGTTQTVREVPQGQ